MLDIKFIKENRELIKENIKKKKCQGRCRFITRNL